MRKWPAPSNCSARVSSMAVRTPASAATESARGIAVFRTARRARPPDPRTRAAVPASVTGTVNARLAAWSPSRVPRTAIAARASAARGSAARPSAIHAATGFLPLSAPRKSATRIPASVSPTATDPASGIRIAARATARSAILASSAASRLVFLHMASRGAASGMPTTTATAATSRPSRARRTATAAPTRASAGTASDASSPRPW